VVGLVLLYLAAIRTGLGQRLDEATFGSLDAARNPNVFAATDDLLRTIDVSSILILGAGIAALGLARRRVGAVVGAGLLVLGANVTTQVLKSALERPDLVLDGVIPAASFPSGHTTVAMSLALALVLVASPSTRPAAAVVGGAYAAAVGTGVLLLEWHRLSDVLGAFLVCTAWFGVAAALAAAIERPGRAREGGRPGPTALAAAGVLAIGFFGVAAWALARRVDVLTVAEYQRELAAASLVVLVAATLAVGVAARLLTGAERRPTARRRTAPSRSR
jgi:membrane-associated phospholipid phosphatase